ncbi:MAG: Rieske (2Fe-2S) protein [Deltaproteobacteria bacterium]|nr:Rieske (2Fe-2S) protein [Deltaproteobacteria bacterium]MDE0341665.1 Rieske (2Fe-2S) protein [Deltaproteobacteria bacterium]
MDAEIDSEESVGVTYIPVARADELEPGQRKAVELNGRALVVTRLENDYFAFSRYCPHESADLMNGPILAGKVRCDNHGYCFDLNSGECVLPKGADPLTVLPVEERGEDLCIRIEW